MSLRKLKPLRKLPANAVCFVDIDEPDYRKYVIKKVEDKRVKIVQEFSARVTVIVADTRRKKEWSRDHGPGGGMTSDRRSQDRPADLARDTKVDEKHTAATKRGKAMIERAAGVTVRQTESAHDANLRIVKEKNIAVLHYEELVGAIDRQMIQDALAKEDHVPSHPLRAQHPTFVMSFGENARPIVREFPPLRDGRSSLPYLDLHARPGVAAIIYPAEKDKEREKAGEAADPGKRGAPPGGRARKDGAQQRERERAREAVRAHKSGFCEVCNVRFPDHRLHVESQVHIDKKHQDPMNAKLAAEFPPPVPPPRGQPMEPSVFPVRVERVQVECAELETEAARVRRELAEVDAALVKGEEDYRRHTQLAVEAAMQVDRGRARAVELAAQREAIEARHAEVRIRLEALEAPFRGYNAPGWAEGGAWTEGWKHLVQRQEGEGAATRAPAPAPAPPEMGGGEQGAAQACPRVAKENAAASQGAGQGARHLGEAEQAVSESHGRARAGCKEGSSECESAGDAEGGGGGGGEGGGGGAGVGAEYPPETPGPVVVPPATRRRGGDESRHAPPPPLEATATKSAERRGSRGTSSGGQLQAAEADGGAPGSVTRGRGAMPRLLLVALPLPRAGGRGKKRTRYWGEGDDEGEGEEEEGGAPALGGAGVGVEGGSPLSRALRRPRARSARRRSERGARGDM